MQLLAGPFPLRLMPGVSRRRQGTMPCRGLNDRQCSFPPDDESGSGSRAIRATHGFAFVRGLEAAWRQSAPIPTMPSVDATSWCLVRSGQRSRTEVFPCQASCRGSPSGPHDRSWEMSPCHANEQGACPSRKRQAAVHADIGQVDVLRRSRQINRESIPPAAVLPTCSRTLQNRGSFEFAIPLPRIPVCKLLQRDPHAKIYRWRF